MNDVTQILEAIDQGDPRAAEQLLPVVYEELRRLAAQRLALEKPGQTLQATALVHEAWLRLSGSKQIQWNDRTHFFATAAEAMRHILIDNARRKKRDKHGGSHQRVELADHADTKQQSIDELLALDEALTKLAQKHPVKADLVKLRYFAGLTVPEAARALGISTTTADRYWTYARAWLFRELAPEDGAEPGVGEAGET